MKLRRIFSAFFALSLLCTCFSVTMSASAASSTLYETYYYYQSSGNNKYFSVELVNENTGTLDVGSDYVGGLGGVCVVPNPAGNPEKPLAIKHPGIKDVGFALADVDFIRLNYDYSGSYRGRMMLKLGKDDFNLTKDIYVYSMETVKKTSGVQMLNFDVREVTEGYIFDDGIIPSLEIYPFAEKLSGDLSATKDYVSFSDIIFAGSNSPTMQTVLSNTSFRKYPIYFMPGSGNITGTAPATKFAAVGGNVTLPECTFTREGYEFAGWLAANGFDTYAPGETYTVVKRNIDGYQTGRMYFVATWEKTEENADANVASSSTFFSAFVTPTSVNNVQVTGIQDSSRYTKNFNFDGVNTVKFEFFPNESDSNRTFSLDCYNWGTLPLDISKYKYLAIPYYYKTSAAKPLATTPAFIFQKTGATCLSASASAKNTSGSIVANQWAVMTFEFDVTDATSSIGKSYIADSGNDFINQTHFRPFGGTTVSKFKEDDEFYLGDFILYEEAPSSAPLLNRSFIDGDGDGNFRPTQTITNAEAAAMLVKAMGVLDDVLEGYTETGYSDITSAHWAYNYVCYLESIGVLKPETGATFNPAAEAVREDFVRQVVVAKGGETDSAAVAMQLAAGNKKLSRAEAVNVINSVYFDRNYDAGDVEPLFEDFFYDVTPEAWFYQDIVLAAMPTISYTDANGVNKVAGVYESTLGIPESLVDSAVEYVENLDVITAERIEEIRNTESEWDEKSGGTVYYISTSTGSASNAGTSMTKPKKISTLEEIGGEKTNPLNLKPGDVVLFKRGDIFRGFMYAKSGVTYSAYGDGEKPVLTRSPENGADSSKWTLVHEDKSVTPSKKIWKYTNEDIIDIGAVMLMKKTTGTVTGDPKTYAHTVAYKEVPSYRKVTKQGTPTVVKVFVYDEEGNVKKDKDGNPITKDVIEIQNIEDKTDEGKYYVRGYLPYQNNNADGTYDTVGIPFDFKTELDRDLEFFHDTNDTEHMETTLRSNLNTTFVNNTGITEIQTPNVKTATGPLYLRCDAGNPGTVYNRIEFNPHGSVLRVGNEDAVTVDNLCFMYFGTHGVSASTCNNLTVRNCEIGWGGGTVQNYNPKNNNPGYVTRLGNGVEVFGGCRNFRIDNCYVYQIYDAGITHQYSGSGTASCLMEGVYYTNNVLEDSIYNIEYFLGLNSEHPDLMRFMNGVLFENNICRRAGYGWGVQRPDANLPSNIRAGSGNLASEYVIKNNIFDRTVDFQKDDSRISSMDSNLRVNTGFPQCSIPYFVDNAHVQVPGRIILECGKSRLCGIRSEQDFRDIDGIGNKVYMYPDDFSEYVTKHILYQPPEY